MRRLPYRLWGNTPGTRAGRSRGYRFDAFGVAVLHRLAPVSGVSRLGPAGIFAEGGRGTAWFGVGRALQPEHFLPRALDLPLLPADGALFLQTALAEVEVYAYGRRTSSSGSCHSGAAALRKRC